MIEKQHCSCLVHHTSDLQIANTSFAGEIPTDQFKKHPITKLGTYSDRPISCISDLFWEQAWQTIYLLSTKFLILNTSSKMLLKQERKTEMEILY